jgi:hypothetical protein
MRSDRSLADNTLTLSKLNFLSAHPRLVLDVAEGSLLSHNIFSHIRRSRLLRNGRRRARKTLNRRKRWFVDNIIMHHKRLHDRNRENIIKSARDKAIAKKEALQKQQLEKNKPKTQKYPSQAEKWREVIRVREKSREIQNRLQAQKIRANSRWRAVIEEKKESNG